MCPIVRLSASHSVMCVFQTSGYVGLVRIGLSSAAVIYDLMLPPPAPPPAPPVPPVPPPPPGACRAGGIHIHHTLGCFNYSGWQSPGVGPVLPIYQAKVEGHTDLESCAAACYLARLTTAGIQDGKHCFCGTAAELAGAAAKALSVPKSACMGVPCEGSVGQKECGGVETMLAYAFTCDKLPQEQLAAEHAAAEAADFHNPATSFSMRIDLVGESATSYVEV
jgi:hypothetical protein